MKVAAIQMPTVKDKMQNIRTAGTYMKKIKAEQPDFVILPEMFCCPYQTENFQFMQKKKVVHRGRRCLIMQGNTIFI